MKIHLAGGRWLVLFAFAALTFCVRIDRGLDLPSWHEFDDAAIARNYVREGFHLLNPTIDWRKDGPGYTEMEFPALPWTMAIFYRVFGVHEVIGRLLSCAATLLSLLVFSQLARYLLPEAAALAAGTFFALNRIVVFAASSIQPESLMLLFYLLAAYHFLLWYDKRGTVHYWIALLSTSAAVLAKLPSIHLGIFFLALFLMRDGKAALRSAAFWCYGLVSLCPALLWYAHAHSFWTTFQNSMGLSNEFHWIDWDVFHDPKFIAGLFGLELLDVWSVGGLLIAGIALRQFRHNRVTQVCALWLASIMLYYLVAIRTTSAPWAWYYHIVSVAPAALLFGAGVEQLQTRPLKIPLLLVYSAGSLLAIAATWRMAAARLISRLPLLAQQVDLKTPWIVDLAAIGGTLLLISWLFRVPPSSMPDELKSGVAGPYTAIALGVAGTFLTCFHLLLGDWQRYGTESRLHVCATEFSNHIPESAMVVTSGGICADSTGHPVASDAPYMFYWLNRKGFSLCEGKQSIDLVQQYRSRGAAYFVAEQEAFKKNPGFEREVRSRYSLAAECSTAALFDLKPVGQKR